MFPVVIGVITHRPNHITQLHNVILSCQREDRHVILQSLRVSKHITGSNPLHLLTKILLQFSCEFVQRRRMSTSDGVEDNEGFTAGRKASAVYAAANSSVYPYVCPSVRHIPVLCQNEGTQGDAVFDSPVSLVF